MELHHRGPTGPFTNGIVFNILFVKALEGPNVVKEEEQKLNVTVNHREEAWPRFISLQERAPSVKVNPSTDY